MLCPVCGGAVYLNFPGVGTLRGLATALDTGQTPDFTSGRWSGSGHWSGPRLLSLENGGDGHRHRGHWVKVATIDNHISCLASSAASSLLLVCPVVLRLLTLRSFCKPCVCQSRSV